MKSDLPDLAQTEPCLCTRTIADRHIALAFDQRGREIARVQRIEFEADVRMSVMQFRDGFGNDAEAKGGEDAEPDVAATPRSDVLRRAPECANLRIDLVHFAEQLMRGVGRLQPTLAPLEQRIAQLVLRMAQHLADRRLGHVQFLRGPGYGAVPVDGVEDFDMA